MKKKINSRDKGKKAELEVAHYFTNRGFPTRRGQQFSGGLDSPDIICDLLPHYHFEVKRTERGNLYNWVDQAVNDSKGQKTPVVIHRRSNQPWVAILMIDDFLKLVTPQIKLS